MENSLRHETTILETRNFGRVIEHRLTHETSILENQFVLYSTMEAISLPRCLMVFIDLEKANDRVPREVMWWVLENKRVSLKYIKLIKDMNDEVVTSEKKCKYHK
jgi:hypothetical protein